MKSITLILEDANDAIFNILSPRSSRSKAGSRSTVRPAPADNQHRSSEYDRRSQDRKPRYKITVQKTQDIPFAIKMWCSLFGHKLQVSPYPIHRSPRHHLNPNFTYVMRGQEPGEGASFVRQRPSRRRQYMYAHHYEDEGTDFEGPRLRSYETQPDWHGHMPCPGPLPLHTHLTHLPDSRITGAPRTNGSAPTPAHPPSLRRRAASPDSISSTNSHNSSSTFSPSSSDFTPHATRPTKPPPPAKPSITQRKVRFANPTIEDELESTQRTSPVQRATSTSTSEPDPSTTQPPPFADPRTPTLDPWYATPYPVCEPHANAQQPYYHSQYYTPYTESPQGATYQTPKFPGENSNWHNHPIYDESYGGHGIMREPKYISRPYLPGMREV